MRHALQVLSVLLVLVVPEFTRAATYAVGPRERYRSVTAVAALLQPGDVVELADGDYESFALTANGTAESPVFIRGRCRIENGRMVRPRVRADGSAPGIACRGRWNTVEGLDISGAPPGGGFESGSGIYIAADNVTIRNCLVHHNGQGIYGDLDSSGNVRVELCEFDSNGGIASNGNFLHTMYFCSSIPGATTIVEHCHVHDAVHGNLLKSRTSRNVIRYNWFENQYHQAIRIVDTTVSSKQADSAGLYPMHSDIVGNVFVAGYSPGPRWSVLTLGGEGDSAAGTEGDFSIAHNLFLLGSGGLDVPRAVHAQGNVNCVRLYANIFLNTLNAPFKSYGRGEVWQSDRTRSFVSRRGSEDPSVQGLNKWIDICDGWIPDGLSGTITGRDPIFSDLLRADFRPARRSALVGAGACPLPKGRLVDLVPEYEPRRGIPADLRPTPRRKVAPPSIGPFEVQD